MSFEPTSIGTVTFTPVVAGTKAVVSQVNVPFQTFTDRLNSLTADMASAAAAINGATNGSSNMSGQLDTIVTTLLGGVAAGVWPNRTYTFAAEAVTGFKVSRDVFFYFETPITLTTPQPIMRMSVARTLKKAGIAHYRNNALPLTTECVLSVRKVVNAVQTEIGQIIIKPADVDKTFTSDTTNFATDIEFAAGDGLTVVPTTIPGSGNAPQDISIILTFEEKLRVV